MFKNKNHNDTLRSKLKGLLVLSLWYPLYIIYLVTVGINKSPDVSFAAWDHQKDLILGLMALIIIFSQLVTFFYVMYRLIKDRFVFEDLFGFLLVPLAIVYSILLIFSFAISQVIISIIT